MVKPILQVKNLSIKFKNDNFSFQAVKDISFVIAQGSCKALVGESGSGKSLTALSIMQLLPDSARVSNKSHIVWHGEDLLDISENRMRQIRGGQIGMIFQDAMSAFNPVYTIGQQLAEVFYNHQRISKKKSMDSMITILEEVGIKDPRLCLKQYPHQLSGGMRQRAMIAMALAGKPDFLIADEPSTSLDVTIQAQVIELLKYLRVAKGMTILFISHDLAVVSQLADEIVVMRQGEVVEQDAAVDFFQQPRDSYSKELLASVPSLVPSHHPNSHADKILEVKDIKVHFPLKKGIFRRTYDYIRAVDGISFDLHQAQTLAVVGESGSGKTTLAKAVLQLIPSHAGQVSYLGNDLIHMNRHRLQKLRADLQLVFQDPYAALNPRMRIVDSIVEGLVVQGKITGLEKKVAKAQHLMRLVGCDPDKIWSYPHEFSGGQRQRICIARALAMDPKVIILDEPTSALDVSIQKQIIELLLDLQQKMQLSYILITHNLGVVAEMAHQVLVMQHGKLIEYGDAQSVLRYPEQSYTKALLAAIPRIKTKLSQPKTKQNPADL